jgi:hypothetical protein
VWILAACPIPQIREPQLAVGIATRNADQNPRHSEAQTTLGVAHYGVSNWIAAIDALERAEQLDVGGELTRWLFLSMAHCRKGTRIRGVVGSTRRQNGSRSTPGTTLNYAAYTPRLQPCWA